MKIWTITTDTESDSIQTAVHVSEESAKAMFARMVAASWESWFGDDDMPADTAEAYKELLEEPGFFDTITLQEHEVGADPCRAALGQLLDQVYQMQGMFDDEDGAIERAVKDAEEALEATA